MAYIIRFLLPVTPSQSPIALRFAGDFAVCSETQIFISTSLESVIEDEIVSVVETLINLDCIVEGVGKHDRIPCPETELFTSVDLESCAFSVVLEITSLQLLQESVFTLSQQLDEIPLLLKTGIQPKITYPEYSVIVKSNLPLPAFVIATFGEDADDVNANCFLFLNISAETNISIPIPEVEISFRPFFYQISSSFSLPIDETDFSLIPSLSRGYHLIADVFIPETTFTLVRESPFDPYIHLETTCSSTRLSQSTSETLINIIGVSDYIYSLYNISIPEVSLDSSLYTDRLYQRAHNCPLHSSIPFPSDIREANVSYFYPEVYEPFGDLVALSYDESTLAVVCQRVDVYGTYWDFLVYKWEDNQWNRRGYLNLTPPTSEWVIQKKYVSLNYNGSLCCYDRALFSLMDYAPYKLYRGFAPKRSNGTNTYDAVANGKINTSGDHYVDAFYNSLYSVHYYTFQVYSLSVVNNKFIFQVKGAVILKTFSSPIQYDFSLSGDGNRLVVVTSPIEKLGHITTSTNNTMIDSRIRLYNIYTFEFTNGVWEEQTICNYPITAYPINDVLNLVSSGGPYFSIPPLSISLSTDGNVLVISNTYICDWINNSWILRGDSLIERTPAYTGIAFTEVNGTITNNYYATYTNYIQSVSLSENLIAVSKRFRPSAYDYTLEDNIVFLSNNDRFVSCNSEIELNTSCDYPIGSNFVEIGITILLLSIDEISIDIQVVAEIPTTYFSLTTNLVILLNPSQRREYRTSFTIPKGDYEDFGCSVSLSNDGRRLVIASSEYVLTYNYTTEWNKQTIDLEAVNSVVCLDSEGTLLIVGEPLLNRVRTFSYNSGEWEYENVLTGSGNFGCSVAMSGNVLVIGAENYDNKGEVYVYDKSNDAWVFRNSISGGINNERFGLSVGLAINGTMLVVASKDNDLYEKPASISTYDWDFGWVLRSKVVIDENSPIHYTNLYREQRVGLFPLRRNTCLHNSAWKYAKEMYENNYLSHFGNPEGSSNPYERMMNEGFLDNYIPPENTAIYPMGENVQMRYPYSFPSSEQLIEVWKDSPGHAANMCGLGKSVSPTLDSQELIDLYNQTISEFILRTDMDREDQYKEIGIGVWNNKAVQNFGYRMDGVGVYYRGEVEIPHKVSISLTEDGQLLCIGSEEWTNKFSYDGSVQMLKPFGDIWVDVNFPLESFPIKPYRLRYGTIINWRQRFPLVSTNSFLDANFGRAISLDMSGKRLIVSDRESVYIYYGYSNSYKLAGVIKEGSNGVPVVTRFINSRGVVERTQMSEENGIFEIKELPNNEISAVLFHNRLQGSKNDVVVKTRPVYYLEEY